MTCCIKHPEFSVIFELPSDVRISPLLLPTVNDSRDQRNILTKDGKSIGHILVTDHLKVVDTFTAEMFQKAIVVTGTVTEINSTQYTCEYGGSISKGWKVSFKVNGVQFYSNVVFLQLGISVKTDSANEEGILISFWHSAKEAEKVDKWSAEIVDSVYIKAPQQQKTHPVFYLLSITTASNLLESFTSFTNDVPIYGYHRMSQPYPFMSIILSFLFVLFWIGAWQKKIWGVVSLAILFATLGITGILSWLVAINSQNYFIASLTMGGFFAAIWYANVVLCTITAILIGIFHAHLIKED